MIDYDLFTAQQRGSSSRDCPTEGCSVLTSKSQPARRLVQRLVRTKSQVSYILPAIAQSHEFASAYVPTCQPLARSSVTLTLSQVS